MQGWTSMPTLFLIRNRISLRNSISLSSPFREDASVNRIIFSFFFKSTRITFSLHPHLILLHIDRKLDLKTWLFSLFVQSCILDKERFIFLLWKSRLNSKKIAFRIEITASYTFFVQKSRNLKFLFHWTKHT